MVLVGAPATARLSRSPAEKQPRLGGRASVALLQMRVKSGGSACAGVSECSALMGIQDMPPVPEKLLFVLTKDIGDFQPNVRSPLSTVILREANGFELETVERVWRSLYPHGRNAQIAGGGLNVGMAEENLDGAQIGAGFQHVHRIAVSTMSSKT
jgi:hypothetical protein